MFDRRKRPAEPPKGPEPLGEILSRVFTARGWGRKQDRLRLEQAWAEAVGPEHAPHTRVNGLRRGVLAMDYGTTAWLSFYLPPGTCVQQAIQRIRWVNFPPPAPEQLTGTLLFVDEAQLGLRPYVTQRFGHVARAAELSRMRGPLVIETYAVYQLSEPRGEVLDNSPPPELAH